MKRFFPAFLFLGFWLGNPLKPRVNGNGRAHPLLRPKTLPVGSILRLKNSEPVILEGGTVWTEISNHAAVRLVAAFNTTKPSTHKLSHPMQTSALPDPRR